MKYNGMIGLSILQEARGYRSSRRSLAYIALGLILGFCLANISYFTTSGVLKIRYDGRNSDNQASDTTIVDLKQSSNPVDLSMDLYNQVRVLCWIMTGPDNHLTKAIHVKRTWGKRCNKLLIMSSIEDDKVGSIALNVSEGRDNLWAKTKEAFKYIHKYHLNDADWFLKADDDTYTVVENLRLLLYPYSPETPIYFGCRFKAIVRQGYMAGGAGYVLSKESVRRFVEIAIPNSTICRGDNDGPEDAEIGKCLQEVNVTAGDARDEEARMRFLPIDPEYHLLTKPGEGYDWYWTYIYYKNKGGLDCCSKNVISFHYVEPAKMYVYDYFIYSVEAFGIQRAPQVLPERLKVGETEPSPTDAIDYVTEV